MLCMFSVKARIRVHAIPIQSKVVLAPLLVTTRALCDLFPDYVGAVLLDLIVLLVDGVILCLIALLHSLRSFHVVF